MCTWGAPGCRLAGWTVGSRWEGCVDAWTCWGAATSQERAGQLWTVLECSFAMGLGRVGVCTASCLDDKGGRQVAHKHFVQRFQAMAMAGEKVLDEQARRTLMGEEFDLLSCKFIAAWPSGGRGACVTGLSHT
jgi:hypothetical protein